MFLEKLAFIPSLREFQTIPKIISVWYNYIYSWNFGFASCLMCFMKISLLITVGVVLFIVVSDWLKFEVDRL